MHVYKICDVYKQPQIYPRTTAIITVVSLQNKWGLSFEAMKDPWICHCILYNGRSRSGTTLTSTIFHIKDNRL